MFHELCRLNKMCAPQTKDSALLPRGLFFLSQAVRQPPCRAPSLFLLSATQPVIPLLCAGVTTGSFSSTKTLWGAGFRGVLDELLGISLSKLSGLELSAAGSDRKGPISRIGVSWLFNQKEKL